MRKGEKTAGDHGNLKLLGNLPHYGIFGIVARIRISKPNIKWTVYNNMNSMAEEFVANVLSNCN